MKKATVLSLKPGKRKAKAIICIPDQEKNRDTLKESRMPDTRKTVYVVIAAINAYSEWKGEQPVISDRDLMYDATPLELGTALGTIIQLRADFYKVPSDEQKDEQPEGKKPASEKNA